MTKRLVRVRYRNPKADGDSPFKGIVVARATLMRHVEGGVPDDFITTKAKFSSTAGAALSYTDNEGNPQVAPAEAGAAWFWIDVNDEAPYANLWAWIFTARPASDERCVQVPTGVGICEFGDLPPLNKADFTEADAPLPGWSAALSQEVTDRTDADSALQTDIDAKVPLTRTVNGHALSANVTVSKADVGLGSVDNTADADKPVSTLQAAADAAVLASIETEVADAAEVQMAGLELGHAERTTNFTTTSVALGAYIPELTFTIVGQGRPVDIEFFCSAARHSVASTGVAIYLEVNGSAVLTQCQATNVSSPSTTSGRAAYFRRRTVLADGVSYTFKVGVLGTAAGTCTLNGSTGAAIELTATSR